MKKPNHLINSPNGYILVTVLLILALLFGMGIHASKLSIMEREISANMLFYQQTYYTAEAGIEHGKTLLEKFSHQADSGLDDIQTEANLIPGSRLGNYRYQVRILKPDDENEYMDQAGLIWLRSDATGPRGTQTSILVLLKHEKEYLLPDGYAGGNHSNDKDAITDFTQQME